MSSTKQKQTQAKKPEVKIPLKPVAAASGPELELEPDRTIEGNDEELNALINAGEASSEESVYQPGPDEGEGAEETEAGAKKEKPTFTGASDEPTAANFIDGRSAVEILDNVLSSLGSFAASRFMGMQVKPSTFQATPDEKEMLTPSMQKVLEHYKVKFDNPLQGLAIMLGVVYGGKVLKLYNLRQNAIQANPAPVSRPAQQYQPVEDNPETAPVFSHANPAPFGFKKDGTPRLTSSGRKPGQAKNPGAYKRR